MKRRQFIKASVLGPFAVASASPGLMGVKRAIGSPLVISTWEHGLAANETAMRILRSDGSSLDAVEAGARIPEADPRVTSVGYGGIPDRDGHVTLDASIMDADGNAGAVAFLEGIKHPVSVARLVMEKTKHVITHAKNQTERRPG